jgi:hypothetical protein
VRRRPGRKKRGSSSPGEPPLPEWDFSRCPPEELELSNCRGYEYSRSSKLIRKTVARLRAGNDDPLTQAVILVFPLPLALWLPKSQWWPNTPYLAIPKEERSSLVSSFHRSQTKQASESLAALVDPFGDDHLHDTTGGCIIPIYVPRGERMDFLQRAVTDLLRRDYPELLERSNRFRSSHRSDQLMDNLKFLSAWRLSEHGYTAKAAIALAKKHRVETYDTVRGYRDAVAKAQKAISALEQSLQQLAARLK